MKIAKIFTIIATIFFFLSAVGTLIEVPHFNNILTENAFHGANLVIFVPIIEIVFALICFVYWYYINKKSNDGIKVNYALLTSIILFILSIILPWALIVWFILKPIYSS